MSNLNCMNCTVAACEHAERERPSFCVQPHVSEEVCKEANELYFSPENYAIVEAASLVVEETAGSTRVQDTIKFAHYLGAKRIGIATCTIMLNETRVLAKLLRAAGFEVEGIGCKVGDNHRADFDLEPAKNGTDPVLCNPIMQAMLLNEAHTDLNVIMGLCVGHDALFSKYSDAPVTTLVAKDFLAANNPCAVLYTAGTNGVYNSRIQRTIEDVRNAREGQDR